MTATRSQALPVNSTSPRSSREHPPRQQRNGNTAGPRRAAGPRRPGLLASLEAGLPRRYPGSAGETRLREID